MTKNNSTIPQSIYAVASGSTSSAPFVTYFSTTDPTSSDVSFPIQQRWFNTVLMHEWILVSFTVVAEVKTANWASISSGVASTESLTGNTGGAVLPDGSNTIFVVGDTTTINISGNAATHTLTASTSGAVATTYTENSGTATPSAGNLNIFGTNAASTSGSSNTVTVNAINCAKWIVDPVPGVGTHTTVGAAIAAASSGQTIFVRPGTYTENLTLSSGINITAFPGDAFIPSVTIIGKCSYSSAGSVCLNNIRLQTNADFLLSVSGSNASNVTLSNCYLNITNNTAISFTSSNASSQIQILSCYGNIGTTGITIFTSSAAGNIIANYSQIGNSGNSTTASTISSGVFASQYCSFVNPFSSSSTGTIFIDRSNVNTEPTNVLAITANGAANHIIELSEISSGTASNISVGAGAFVTANLCQLNTTNAHAVVGAGTINYSSLALPSGGDINATTTNKTNFYAGNIL